MNELTFNIVLFDCTLELAAFDSSALYLSLSKHAKFYLYCYAVTSTVIEEDKAPILHPQEGSVALSPF